MSRKQVLDVASAGYSEMADLKISTHQKEIVELAAAYSGGFIIDLIEAGILAKGPNWEGE